MDGVTVVAVAVIGIIVALILIASVYARYYIKVPPDVVAVFTGRRGFRVVRGGASFRVPGIERVDYMSLTPFETELPIRGAYSQNGVPVNMDAVALVRLDSADEAIRTSAERFLNVDRQQLQASVQEILAGHLRSICAKMTVEELNSNRELLVQRVTDEAGSDFAGIGMNLDVLTIQHISDDQGYLENLGRKRVAEVKRDAEIGEAEALRDSMRQSAEARRLGETAQAESDASIAEAQRDRDLRIARARAQVAAETARAEQAGPLANAEAQREVTKAEVAVEEERVRASIAVEQQEVMRQQQALEASVIKPAEAERQAAVIRAEGVREATVRQAEGTSRAAALDGEGESRRRISIAEARQRELESEGQGEALARTVKAEALQKELEAEAAGKRALLLGEAEGRRRLAEALNLYNESALQLTVYPDLIARLPEIAGQIAAPLGQVDKIVMIDGGGNGNGNGSGPLGKFSGTVPMLLAHSIETLRAVGLDLPGLLNAETEEASTNGSAPAPRPAAPANDPARATIDRIAVDADSQPAPPEAP